MGTWLKRSASKKKYVFNHEHESMDQILEGLFKSDQPDKIKETFVARVCEQGTQGSHNESTVKGILQVSSKWILNGTTTLQVKSGFDLFESWGIHNRDIFLMFFTPNLTAEMLTHGYGGMAANVPLLLREGFRVMSHGGAGLDNEHVQVVQSNITKFVCSTRERVVVRNVSLLLREFTECIPSHANEKTNFCVSIIHHLSVGVPPEQGQVIPKFVRDTDDIAFFLNVMWTPHPSLLLDTCLATIFHIISTSRTDEMSEPAICLAAVVKHIPIEMASRVVKDVVTDKSITDASLEAAVGQIVEWLKWPTAVNVDMWLLCFLSELAKAQKYTLLVGIIEANAEQVAETLAYPGLRYAGFKVLSQMLLGFHHSPGPFHKCLEKIPIIVHVLRNEGSAQSGAFLKEFSELIYDLMYQHTGFPELYEPVLELIKDFPQPSVDEIKIKLNQIRWLSQAGCISVIETATPSLLVSAVKQEKLELGKAGLENLGNTCYMNSVLQALYMCDQFRRGVLSKTPTGKEGLLVKLQHVFAQLSQSSRPAIAPSKFLQSSRPPWFLPGHQQDCSEFLKYLLDQLHEDEKSSSTNVGMKKSQSSGSLSPNGTVRINNTGTLSKAERKKAVVTLTSLKMKTDDEMNGVNGSAAGNLDTDKCSESVQSLIERTFRGKVQTTLRCLACQQISSRVESFADIPLAFPNSSRPAEYLQKNLAGGNDVSSADVPMESTPPEAAGEVDLPKTSDASFDLSDLISFYLKPEKLTGDNKYHCDQCGKLQDGERSIQIVESPQYLILTLLRFSYDTKLQTRTKIFQDVHYPRTLAVPVCDESSVASRDGKADFQKHYARSSSCANPRNGADLVDVYQMKLEDIAARLAPKCESTTQVSSRCHLYGLTSVIVHSGASSECGHYYCYARHSQTGQVKAKLLDKVSGNLDNLDLLSDRWYSFNDSRVSHATFDSFSNVTKKFSKDTAYVLIYRKLAYEDQALGVNMEPALRPDLRDAVIKDNETYLKEQELEARAREEQRRRRSSSVNSANLNNWQSKDDDDDDSHKGHPGYTNGLGSGLDITGSRFVF